MNCKLSKIWPVLIIMICAGHAYAQEYSVASPDGLLKIDVSISSSIQYEVHYNTISVITPSIISVSLNTGLVLGKDATVQSTETRSVDEEISRLYGKNAQLTDHFNELKILFTENYSLIIRAYDEGVAYRFQTALVGDILVESEEANFNFVDSPGVIFPESDGAMQSWERSYDTYSSIQDIATNKFSITPAMFSYVASGIRVVVAESDLFDYPGMYLQRNATNGMKGKWAQYPKTVSDPDDLYAYHRVLTRESYLAKTSGTRLYPWRVVIVSSEDKDLLNNELIYKLARPTELTNTAYIKPGKSAWEWWHDAILETNQIPSGNTHLGYDLYKYYVDFAAQYKLEYITMDAGWSTDYAQKVCQYAATKNVKVFVWDFINLPVVNPERLTQIKNLGAAGVKVDLIERDDQVAINWFEQLAKACADRGLMIIFHGCAKPTGLQRTYPNILNFEAVRGAECTKWDFSANPRYHVQFPFIRMLAGPLDYTPGSMRNVHQSQFTAIPTGIPMTMGTRTHELAMYILFDQPLGYLCDSPTEYRKFSNVMSFLSKVPTTWDKTLPLAASVGEYAVIARQKGEEWYVGAMTNEDDREIEIDFSFLPEGVEKSADILRDNDDTDINAKAYSHEVISVNNNTKLTYRLAKEGGLVIRVHDLITGVSDNKPDTKLLAYQNLEQTQLILEAGESIQSVTISDLSGKTCYQENFNDRQTVQVIDTSVLAKGFYIVKIKTASRGYTVKVIL